MSIQNLALLLFLLSPLISACSPSAPTEGAEPAADAGATSEPEAPAQSVDLGALSYIFESAAEPVAAAIELDNELTVEALIPIEGGSLSATRAHRTLYTLHIP